MNKELIKKIGKIAGNVLMYLFLIVCVLSIFVTVFAKKDLDGTTEIFGYQMRIVSSDSMDKSEYTDVSSYKIKSIPLHSMVFIKVKPDDPAELDAWYASIQKGDVLTFRYVYTNQVTITHRVVDIVEKEGGGYLIYLEGDNKASDSKLLKQVIDTSESPKTSTNYIIGKVVGKNFLFGLFLSIIKKPIGAICIVIVPCFIIILLEVLRIVGVVNEDKKKKNKEEIEKKDTELEELRRKIAELQANKETDSPEPLVDENPVAEEESIAQEGGEE